MEIQFNGVPKLEVLLDTTKKEWFDIDSIDYLEETFDILDHMGNVRTYNFIDKTLRVKEEL